MNLRQLDESLAALADILQERRLSSHDLGSKPPPSRASEWFDAKFSEIKNSLSKAATGFLYALKNEDKRAAADTLAEMRTAARTIEATVKEAEEIVRYALGAGGGDRLPNVTRRSMDNPGTGPGIQVGPGLPKLKGAINRIFSTLPKKK